MNNYFIGIDVGTGSARAGVFSHTGSMISQASKPITRWSPRADFVEQSSEEIWLAVCDAVRDARSQSKIPPEQIKGLGFDATCSLVVLDSHGKPLTVSPDGQHRHNVIVWMDHRAISQANAINQSRHPLLNYVGGTISPEMQTPKLLWLKQHMPDTWQAAGYFFDLPDYLTWRATRDDSRSLCSTVCKWTYSGHENRWDTSYFQQIGLGELLDNQSAKIGRQIKNIGNSLANGLSACAARAMGLVAGTAVAVSMIDAHAGALGTLGALDDSLTSTASNQGRVDFNRRIALIGGTSSCHMAISNEQRFVTGVWGPYYSALLPNYWLNEGGQSATGALIDHIIYSSSCYDKLNQQAKSNGKTIYQLLNDLLLKLAGKPENIAFLSTDLHILPYFHGNRSPRADASLNGMISGLKLSHNAEDLALAYLATIQSIALGTRHIIDIMNQQGYCIDTIMASGGGTKNPLFVQEHANAAGCVMLLPKESEAVLLGSAMMAAVAAGTIDNLTQAMQQMGHIGYAVYPQTTIIGDYYQRKYQVFLEMYHDQKKYRKIMFS